MELEWDEIKRKTNLEKHGVDFAKALDFEWKRPVYLSMIGLNMAKKDG
jgi:uncharacterized DUF497 family protein